MTTTDDATDDPIDEKTDAPHAENSDERDAIREIVQESDLYVLVFYGSEPWIALVDRDKGPSTSHALPEERIAIIEWASEQPGYVAEGWGVSIATASDRQPNPDWEMPEEPDKTFDDRSEAITFAAAQLADR